MGLDRAQQEFVTYRPTLLYVIVSKTALQDRGTTIKIGVETRCTCMWQTTISVWVSQHGRDKIEKDFVRTAEDGIWQQTQACWQRVKVVIGATYTITGGDSVGSRYSPDSDTCITFSNRSCRLQPRPPHDKGVVVTFVRRPHPFRADSTIADCFEHVQNNRRGLPFCQALSEPLKLHNGISSLFSG